MKRHFGHIFLGVCIVVAALIFTHPPKHQSHHYQWHIDSGIALMDSDTGDIYILSAKDKGTWGMLPPIPVRH
jgi:hypothetical protein